jgi:hypothetical protein
MSLLHRIIRGLFAKPEPSRNPSVRHRQCGTCDNDDYGRDVFRFAPALFATRTDVIAELSDRGFEWLSHYSSVDPIHDCYGIEVCGIRDRDDAAAILNILIKMFPSWRPG